MANVLHRTAGATAPYTKDYRESVNEPDFPESDWIWNPDLSAVSGFDSIYWNISGDLVTLASQATRDARDAELAALQVTNAKESAKGQIDTERVLRGFAEVVVDEINILRAEHSLTSRTLSQLVTAIKSKIDGAP